MRSTPIRTALILASFLLLNCANAHFGRLAAAEPAAGSGATTDSEKNAAVQLAVLQTEVQSLKAERASLQLLLAQAKAAPAASKAESEAKLATALNSYSLIERENEALKANNEKLAAEKAALEARAAEQHPAAPTAAAEPDREQLRQWQAQSAALAAENTELKTRLAAAVAAAEAKPAAPPPAPAPAAVPDQDTTAAKMAVVLRSYTLQQEENDQLKAAQEKLMAEKSALEAQLAVAKDALPLANQAAGLREQLRQTQDQLAALSLENNELKTRLATGGIAPGTGRSESLHPVSVPTTQAPATLPAPAPAPRMHVVAAGDTLGKIARQYYGNANRWPDILAANRDVLKDEKSLLVGTKLRIP